MRNTLWLVILIFIPDLTLAADDEGGEAIRSIIDIFNLDPRSLDTILHATNAPGIIASISNVINSAALSAAVALMIWTTITMTANTAHEGEPGGKKYSNLWIPLRSAFSLALVMPIAKGYSLVQIMVLLLAMLGFKFADMTWDAVLKHFQNTGPIVNVSPPDTEQIVVALYKSHLCGLKLNSFEFRGKKQQKVTVKARRQIDKDGTKTYVYTFDGKAGIGMGDAVCGSFTIKHPPGPISTYMHEATIKNFNELSVHLNKEARYYLNSKKKSSRAVQKKIADSIQRLIYAYNIAIRAAAARAVQQGENEVNQANKAFYKEAREAGWIYAGAWFWTMAGINRQISDAVAVRPTFTSPKYDRMSKFWRLELENDLIRTNTTIIPKMESVGVAGLVSTLSVGDTHDTISRLTNKMLSPLLDRISAFFLEGGHAEAKLQSLGHWIIGAAEALAVAKIIAKATADAAARAQSKSVTSWFPGLGEATGAAAGFTQSILESIFAYLKLVVVALFLLGLLLAFYFPAIPFINWFSAIIGWLVMLIEAVFAAPFWAAAHAVPEGDGIAGSHGKAGWMLVLSLIARPVLMIAGLVGAMLLLHYGSELLLVMFAPFAKSMTAGSITGIVSILGLLTLLVVAVLILAKTAFSLVYVIPDRTLAWIGQSSANLGETQMGEESKTMFMAAGRGGDQISRAAEKAGSPGSQEQNNQGAQGAQGRTSGSTQSTNDAEEEQHAAGNIAAAGKSAGDEAAGQEGQHAVGGGKPRRQLGDKDA